MSVKSPHPGPLPLAGEGARALRPLFVEGVSLWTPSLPSWAIARAALRGEGEPMDPPSARPTIDLLAPAERRRLPDGVAVALAAAAEATRASGRDAKTLASVFVSTHGDLAVNDAMNKTLATEPTLISPTRFHNSVHNAASGYWSIATGAMAPSTALSAFDASFGAGLFETLVQIESEGEPMLLVACDVQSVGALASVTWSEGLLAAALVLAPERSERTIAAYDALLEPGDAEPTPAHSAAARRHAGNAMHGALPLLESIAGATTGDVVLKVAPSLALRLVPRS